MVGFGLNQRLSVTLYLLRLCLYKLLQACSITLGNFRCQIVPIANPRRAVQSLSASDYPICSKRVIKLVVRLDKSQCFFIFDVIAASKAFALSFEHLNRVLAQFNAAFEVNELQKYISLYTALLLCRKWVLECLHLSRSVRSFLHWDLIWFAFCTDYTRT